MSQVGLAKQPVTSLLTLTRQNAQTFGLEDFEEELNGEQKVRWEAPNYGHFKLMEESILQQEYHLPGHNYAGPGTRVKSNILNDIKPTTALDAAALVHDVEYLSGLYTQADQNITYNLTKVAPSLAVPTYLAMKAKDVVGYEPKVNPLEYKLARDMVLQKGLLNEYPNVVFDPEISAVATAMADQYITDKTVVPNSQPTVLGGL